MAVEAALLAMRRDGVLRTDKAEAARPIPHGSRRISTGKMPNLRRGRCLPVTNHRGLDHTVTVATAS